MPHMNGAGLNLPGKTEVIKIDCTSIFNNDGMVAYGFLRQNVRGSLTEVHVTQSSQRKG